MNRARLLSTVAATLLLTTGAAFAQAEHKDANPAPAPAAQQNAPPEKVAPNMKAGTPRAETHKQGQTPAAADAAKPGAGDHAADKGAMDRAAEKGPIKPSDANGSSTAKPDAAQNSVPNAAPNAAPKSSQTEQPSTTGQGSAASAAKLSSEQRTKITSVFKQHRVEPAKLNISVSVGTRVPETVHYYPVPEEVVVIYPEWRGYDYILVGDQIVIIDPRSHEIVAILEA
jgi:hypothetical protein